MKKYCKIICGLLLTAGTFSGCTLFGLDVQEDYDYTHTAYRTELGMDAYTFMQSRPDLFSSLLEALDYVKDVDPELVNLYKEPNNTYLLLTNTALTDLTVNNSYFSMNKIYNPGAPWPDQYYSPTSWTQISKETVKNLLRYHIVKGLYGYKQLKSDPKWYDTYASGDTAKMNLYLTADRSGYLYINNYVGVPDFIYVSARTPNTTDPLLPGTETKTTITFATLRPRTASLEATNGVVHVMDRWFFPPTRNVLGL